MTLQRLRRFRDWPIKRKLLAVIFATTSIALGLTAAGVLIADTVLFRYSLEQNLSALARVIADSSTAALAFDDPKVASETLAALRLRPHLVTGCIYRPDGSILARYARPDYRSACPEVRTSASMWYTDAGLSLSRPVTLARKRIGTLTLLYDLGEIAERRLLYGGTVLIILVVSSLLSALFSSTLRDKVTVPVFALVDTASAVSRSRNYSLRAEKLTGDEMGILVDAFNDMLGRIQLRDEELHQLLKDREEANRQLVRLNEDLERFAFVASHDLQEPLRMITVYTQLLQKQALLTPGTRSAEYVANIVGGARRMRELLDDLRVYAELGGFEDSGGRVDLNSVIQRAKENLAYAIQTSGAVITSDPLPVVTAHEAHLVPLFQNLIGNAIKYRGPETPRIHIGYHTGSDLCFAVEDNGTGISAEFHEAVFVPFKRLHGASIPGSGLGLSICKRVVERFGGRIWVESQAGQGATFRFTLPEHLLVTKSMEGGAV